MTTNSNKEAEGKKIAAGVEDVGLASTDAPGHSDMTSGSADDHPTSACAKAATSEKTELENDSSGMHKDKAGVTRRDPVGANFGMAKDGQQQDASTAGEGLECVQLERNSTLRPMNIESEPGAFHVLGVGRETTELEEGKEENEEEPDVENPEIGAVMEDVNAEPLDAQLVVENNEVNESANSRKYHQITQVVSREEAVPTPPPLIEAKAESPPSFWQRSGRHLLLVAAFVFLVIVVLVLAISLGVYNKDEGSTSASSPTSGSTSPEPSGELVSVSSVNNTQTNSSLSTLDNIKQRGYLRCAYREFKGHFFKDENGDVKGFEAALCQAVGAAIFGPNPPKVAFTNITGNTRFPFLADDTIDVLSRIASHTMERDVFETNAQTGFTFSVPYNYEGTKFAGDPFYIHNCTEKNFKYIDECSGIRVCTGANTTSLYFLLSEIFPQRYIVPQAYKTEIVQQGFVDGICNVVCHLSFYLGESFVREAGFQGDYAVGNAFLEKMPSAIVTREDDPEFSDFVNAVLLALLLAEEMNITQATADEFPGTLLFGEEYKHMFQHAIGHQGNFGELYRRFLKDDFPRETIDRINDGSTGLLYSFPFGDVDIRRNDTKQPLGEILQQIVLRGKLLCGVRIDRPGFATLNESSDLEGTIYAGMDVDFCRALSASLFGGDDTSVEYVALQDIRDGASLLANGQLDVVAGATWNLEYDVREPSTGMGFAFSKPYFFAPHKGDMAEEENLCLMTRQEDTDWSSFVYWIVESVVYAEESNIDRFTSNIMPEVFFYGEDFKRMFRDAVLAIGNYADVYNRNLAPSMPRSGRNLLNPSDNPGPQIYIPPWALVVAAPEHKSKQNTPTLR